MQHTSLHQLTKSFTPTETLPALFLGHGSPMNAIEENEFVQGFRTIAKGIPTPQAVLCVSAHWETPGTFVTAMENPPTIHDFGGFPRALYDVQYPAPGSPELAALTRDTVKNTKVELTTNWGLDHGAWSVIKHLYPKADIPVIQFSLDYRKAPRAHYELASELNALRNKGVLIIGSGNMVHNLRMVAWDKLNDKDFGYDWTMEARGKMKQFITSRDHSSMINYQAQGTAFQLSIPTPEHYLPLLYILALQREKEQAEFYNDQAVGGSLTMTSVKIS